MLSTIISKLFRRLVLISTLITLLTACHAQSSNSHTINIGTIAGPDEQVLEVVKQVAQQRYGLTLNIVEFDDYNLPNEALSDGSIDANIFQHKPYLDAAIKANHYQLVAIAKTFIYPMGIYSATLKNIHAVPAGAKVAIPNDPSNEARALILLQQAGLIRLNPAVGIDASPSDIISNPKALKITTLDAAQLPRALPDVTLAIINSNYAIPAGLLPTKDAIYIEGADSPYANLIVIRKADQSKPKYQQLVAAYQSAPVLAAAEKIFQGQAIPAWEANS